MRQMLKNKLKDQKGFTLIELLAVIVILGIIAAIAVPSILGIIDNTKKDAHVANAQQMLSAAKMAIASDSTLQSGDHYLTLSQLESLNYLDTVDSPDADGYAKGSTAAPTDLLVSFVKITDGKIVELNLVTTKSVTTSGVTSQVKVRGIHKTPTSTSISSKDITRNDVQ